MDGIEELRDVFDYREVFDILIAAPFEDFEMSGMYDFSFLSRVGDRLQADHGKRVFVPHRDIDRGWMDNKIYTVPSGIVVPTAELIVGYVGSPSAATGVMLGAGIRNKKPIILVAPAGTKIDEIVTSAPLESKVLANIVWFRDELEGIEKTSQAVGDFYKDGN